MNLKTASKSRVLLSTDRCSLPESKRSVVIVCTVEFGIYKLEQPTRKKT